MYKQTPGRFDSGWGPSPPAADTHPGPLQGGQGSARPAVQFGPLYPILLPPSSFHRCLYLINIFHPDSVSASVFGELSLQRRGRGGGQRELGHWPCTHSWALLMAPDLRGGGGLFPSHRLAAPPHGCILSSGDQFKTAASAYQ